MKRSIFFLLAALAGLTVPAEAEEFYIGANIHNGNATGDLVLTECLFEQMGMNAIRSERKWGLVEREDKMCFRNGKTEHMYDLVHNKLHGIVINLLNGAHSAYCGQEKFPTTPEAVEGFCKYAEFSTKETKGIADYQQIWNEFSGQDDERYQHYMNMIRAAAPRIRAIDPDVKILSNSEPEPWTLERMLQAGILDTVDCLSIHPYVAWRGEGKNDAEHWIEIMKEYHDLILKYNNGKDFPVLLTELGWPTSTRHKNGWNFTEHQQAVYFAQVLCMIRSYPWVKGLIMYDFQDDNERDTDPEANFGLMHADCTPKPSYYVFTDLSRLVRKGEFIRRLDAGDPKVWIMQYKLDGKDVWAMWNFYKDQETHIILKNAAEKRTDITVRIAGNTPVRRMWRNVEWLKKGKPLFEDEIKLTLRDMPLILEGDLSQVSLKTPVENLSFQRETETPKKDTP